MRFSARLARLRTTVPAVTLAATMAIGTYLRCQVQVGSSSSSAGPVAPPADAPPARLTFTSYDLEVHLQPASQRLSALARMVIRNDGPTTLARLPLELSSSLRWESLSERSGSGAAVKLDFQQERVDTDTDHTGAESEAMVTLATPLPPGATADLTALYSGSIPLSSARLERSGVPAGEARLADWDAIREGETALRGAGNVLWYPVVSPPIFLGDGARLAESAGDRRRRESGASVRLRLSIEYAGLSPGAAFFCGRLGNFSQGSEAGVAGNSEAGGVATAEFAPAPLGFGSLSLFVVSRPPELARRSLGTVLRDPATADALEREATQAEEVVKEWLGPVRQRQPILIDHPGQPFAQGALLVEGAAAATNPFAMTHLLSHAWFASEEIWLDEGVAQFLPLVAMEHRQGRAAALAVLEDQRPALALAESNAEEASAGESLAQASREVIYRNKAVAVLWMLRSLAGEEALKKALLSLGSRPPGSRGSKEFEAALEQASGKDLRWFFGDWVLADKGLPDLSIVSATARANPERGGVSEGSLVAVEVRNDGAAAAEVPVTVRSGTLTATERLRVPGHAAASVRVLFQGKPQQVEVNDGTVPETSETHHVRALEP